MINSRNISKITVVSKETKETKDTNITEETIKNPFLDLNYFNPALLNQSVSLGSFVDFKFG